MRQVAWRMEKPTVGSIRSHRDLEAWQLAMEIVVEIYRLTKAFPADEKFGLVAQLRRGGARLDYA